MLSPLFLINYTADGGLKTKIRLAEGRLLVGRSVQADIYLDDRSVSRRHAELIVHGSEVIVRDLYSRNGTYVDDVHVTESVARPPQRIRFGTVEFQLAAGEQLGWISGTSSAMDTTEARYPPSSEESNPAVVALTPAQQRVFNLLVEGMIEKQIARELDISPHTVHNHIRAIYRAFGVHTRAELLVRVLPRQN